MSNVMEKTRKHLGLEEVFRANRHFVKTEKAIQSAKIDLLTVVSNKKCDTAILWCKKLMAKASGASRSALLLQSIN